MSPLYRRRPGSRFFLLALFPLLRIVSAAAGKDSPSAPDIGWTLFPDEALVPPRAAYIRESQVSIRLEQQNLPETSPEASFLGVQTSIGASVTVLEHVSPFATWQWGLDTAVYSLFNLEKISADLFNMDYRAGLSMAFREHGSRVSHKIRIGHDSSHLGDEFMVANPEVRREEISFERLEWMLDYRRDDRIRGYAVYSAELRMRGRLSVAEMHHLRAGGEYRHPIKAGGMELLAAYEFSTAQRLQWHGSHALAAGLVFSRRDRREARAVATYYHGNSPQGQFFRDRITTYGFGLFVLH